MQRSHQKISAGGVVILMVVLINAIIMEQGLVSDPLWYKAAYISFPLLFGAVIFGRKNHKS